ncbi:MAG: P63C domain-containing protein [Candidatus Liptonbacteria bacterium]|nr:P63C domain-containing protein [Candidatus Liptonbacteria bacterium]
MDVERITGRAKGGIARAKRLTKKERKTIAMSGAVARWGVESLPGAVCSSEDTPLRIGGVDLDAYVLEDGTRVLSQAGFLRALGRNRRAAYRSVEVPPMLQGASLEPYLTPEILEKSRPIAFRALNGTRANGYRAELLPDVCEVYLKARDAKTLAPNQERVAKQAEILMRALAKVGIIALVDEATGYQELRAKDALARILEEFVAKDLQAYVRTFPDDYYKGMFRLRGLQYPHDTVKRPRYFGMLTNDIVYDRLAPGVLNELRKVTPRNESGNLKYKLFQRLTSNVGYPKLREHLGSVTAIMKLTNSWDEFMGHLNRLHPRYGDTIPMDLTSDDDGRGL